jgi:hypothetical protein
MASGQAAPGRGTKEQRAAYSAELDNVGLVGPQVEGVRVIDFCREKK